MGKLKDMVVEETALTNRLKNNARRLQLASIGLFAKLEAERVRLYKQVVEASETRLGQARGDETLIDKINVLGNGAINLVREESLRLFDELVEAGEKYQAAAKPAARKSTKVVLAVAKPAQVDKPAPAKKAQRKSTQSGVHQDLPEALQQAFAEAQAKVAHISDLPNDKALELMALALQVQEGDVKGRRPAKTKVEECAVFDARRELKGMKQQEAMTQYVETVKQIA